MSRQTTLVRKITISLPVELVEFADREASRLEMSRSGLIAQALAEIRSAQEERLAAEGYRFYATEASDFAASSATAVAEALGHGS